MLMFKAMLVASMRLIAHLQLHHCFITLTQYNASQARSER